jgi:flavin reductase (DIM6/NTAB) family NADH-FMN oxidoreductase RutF
VLEDAIAHFVCDVHERIPGGDHSIFIGHVLDCAAQPGKRPLVYFRSGFGALHDKEAELQRELAVWDAVAYGTLSDE